MKTSQSIKTTVPVVGKLYIVNFAFKTDFLYNEVNFAIKENVTLSKGDILLILKTEETLYNIPCIMLNGTDTLKVTFPSFFFKTPKIYDTKNQQWISQI